jgi:NifB/MoaA-like Fe-S oxidoreductase
MEIAQVERLCQNVASSVSEVRRIFRSPLPVADILDRFWGLQDNLSRLLEALTDQPAETLEALERHPALLTEVVDVLEFSAKLQTLKTIAAVREAGESINSSLVDIQYLRQARAMTASA